MYYLYLNATRRFYFSSAGQSAESQILIASLRDVIRQQSSEVESLQKRLKGATTSQDFQVHPPVARSTCFNTVAGAVD